MTRGNVPALLLSSSIVFYTTEAGRVLAITSLPEPRKLTRYEEYLRADGCAGGSFAEFLGICETHYEERSEMVGDWPHRRVVREYRMYRGDRWSSYGSEMKGDWAPTKKEAKASYKAALKARQEREREYIKEAA
jgi:hypothetical protein